MPTPTALWPIWKPIFPLYLNLLEKMTRPRLALLYLTPIVLLFLLVSGWYAASFLTPKPDPVKFSGQRALTDVQTQLSFGPRTPGSAGHAQIREWMRQELEKAGWSVEIQSVEQSGKTVINLIARRSEAPPQIILGAHYDTRLQADHDPDPARRNEPVPGANDGASAVAVLLELARTQPPKFLPIWLVFFDAEDNGRLPGWDWILGSRAFVAHLTVRPQAVVIVDMVGDADLNIYREKNSDPALAAQIWQTAAELGYSQYFIDQEKYTMLDDHTPFLQAGLPAVDLIDFDYPYWHTTADTADKVSAHSLEVVGQTLLTWLNQQNRQR
ncbi:MAG: M28 family peptidase [Anaerolineae bacterium]